MRRGKFLAYVVLMGVVAMLFSTCSRAPTVQVYDFDHINNRVWIGENFWSVPLEDWSVTNGRIEYSGTGQQSTCSILTTALNSSEGEFTIRFDMGLLDKGSVEGSSGIILGSVASEDEDIRAAVYFGKGINLGINTSGYIFAGQTKRQLPADFDFSSFKIDLTGKANREGFVVTLNVSGINNNHIETVSITPEQPVRGILQFVNNFRNANSGNNGPAFWFDNILIEGEGVKYVDGNSFGPVLWTMHTLSKNVLKLTAQMPPLGKDDNKTVDLQLRNTDGWETAGSELISEDSRTVTFKVENWNSAEDKGYRVVYKYRNLSGTESEHVYTGIIMRDPVGRPLKMGAHR